MTTNKFCFETYLHFNGKMSREGVLDNITTLIRGCWGYSYKDKKHYPIQWGNEIKYAPLNRESLMKDTLIKSVNIIGDIYDYYNAKRLVDEQTHFKPSVTLCKYLYMPNITDFNNLKMKKVEDNIISSTSQLMSMYWKKFKKVKFVQCSQCHSRIARPTVYINKFECPVCHECLLSPFDTMTYNTLAFKNAKYFAERELLRAVEFNNSDTRNLSVIGNVNWLARVDFSITVGKC